MSYDIFRCTRCGEWIDSYRDTFIGDPYRPPQRHKRCESPALPLGSKVSADGLRIISPDSEESDA